MLTLNGYKVLKHEIPVEDVRKVLTVKPFVPKVFVSNPNAVPRYRVYKEVEDSLYLPKHFGIDKYGHPKETTRNVSCTPDMHWSFAGTLRPVQKPVVDSFLLPAPHDGILSLHTGGGKTVCALYIASQLKVPTLVIVHTSFLRDQWEERIRTFLPNARLGRIQGDVCEIEGCDIVVAMLQTLSMKDIPIATFKPLGLVIVDECHHIASEVFVQALPKVTSKYMLGLSATPTRKDGLMHVAHWFLGPLLYNSDTGDKQDSGVHVEVYEYENKDPEFNRILYNNQGVMFTALMINKLAECEDRTRWLVEILQDVLEESPNRQILVLTDRVNHTTALLEALPSSLRDMAAILSPSVSAAKRTDYCKSKTILFATYAMCKEGFDVPTLNTLLMATPRPDVDQIVGRILRVAKDERTIHPLVLDIVDPQFRRQFQERNSLYKKRSYSVMKMQLPPREPSRMGVQAQTET
jgi:superfamily II DNA or RNA helicase